MRSEARRRGLREMGEYKTLEQQIQELWASRGMDVLKEICKPLKDGKIKWTIIARRRGS